MSPPILPTLSSSRPSSPQDGSIPSTGDQDRNDLAIKIEQQRAKIRALELAAQERRQTDQLRLQEQTQRTEFNRQQSRHQGLVMAVCAEDRLVLSYQQEEQRRKDWQAQEETGLQVLLRHKASVAQDAEDMLQQRWALFNQQEEQRRKDKLAQDQSAMQALFRYKAAIKAKEAKEHKLARIREKQQRAEERRLVMIKEKETRDQACYKAAAKAREQKQLLARQREDQRRREREAWDQACLQALERYESATKVRNAQEAGERKLAKLREAEERKLAKLREAEQKKTLRDQEKELRRIEKQKRDDAKRAASLRYESAVRSKKEEDNVLRERVEKQRNARSLGVVQRQAVRSLQEEVRRSVREKRDEAGVQAIQRHKAALQAQKVQQKSLTEGGVVAFDGVLPSFLE